MSTAAFPTDPTDPRFVAAVVGVLATAAVYAYAALGPATVAYELAGRLGA
jgi:hypothetical protein